MKLAAGIHTHTLSIVNRTSATDRLLDKKARDEMAKKAAGKGPLNAGQQGIKKSGKK